MSQEMCENKIIYDSHNLAHRAMRAVAKKDARKCNVYRCDVCGRWHWGHSTMKRRKRMKMIRR